MVLALVRAVALLLLGHWLWPRKVPMTYTAEFMGGPAHGKTFGLPGLDEPPTIVVVETMHVSDGASVMGSSDPESGIGVVQFAYKREVSVLDSGPYWVYTPFDGDFSTLEE
jgi:hypothetical protein